MADTEQREGADATAPVNHDRRGKFAPGNRAGTGGIASWQKELRQQLRSLLPSSKERLASIIRDGTDKDSAAAIRLLWDFTLTKPKQTHRLEHKGDPYAGFSPEQLVEFVKGRKE